MDSELLAVNGARMQGYRLLSSLYLKELTSEQIEALRTLNTSTVESEDTLMAEGLTNMRRFVKGVLGNIRQELAADYAYAILAAAPQSDKRFATPFESVFTSPEGLLMQDARDGVYRYFCEEHLEVPQGLDIPEDHLAFLFDFMAQIIGRQSKAISTQDMAEAERSADVQIAFLREHLLNWIDEYCDVLGCVAQTGFYKGVSQVTRSWVHGDYAVAEDMAAELRKRHLNAVAPQD
ncbi:MAG: molecular chaperone TorD family protein [Coriobacteriales bacterium]|jgi:TorA maturation chaperone TorD|nr:molecular chaperone TorD family protein [Coriobacteriales bacterium]